MLPYLLPHLEYGVLYDKLQLNWATDGDGPVWTSNSTNWTMAMVQVPTFLCPSDDPKAQPRVVSRMALHATTATSGTISVRYYDNTGTPAGLGRTNYVGVAGIFGKIGSSFDSREGIFTNRSRTTVAMIADGTSNTLFFGETLGGHPTDGTRLYSFSWMGSGFNVTNWGLTPPDITFRNFSSKHEGVVNFTLADGSVRPLRESIARLSLVYLSGMKDGVVVSGSEY